jgi:long-chain fatty acid transport protein
MKTLTNSLFLVAGLGGVAWGNAFNINEHDARVSGRGGATAASNTDASSVIFNPGGIPIAEGTQVSIGSSLYVAKGSYRAAADAPKTQTDSSSALVPSLYITSRVHDIVSIGLGVHLPFGLAVSWPERHAQEEVIQDQNLRTFFITPAVGVNLDKQVPGLSLGGGIDLVPATIELERAILFGTERGTAELAGDAFGIGGRIGVMYRPPAVQALKLGVMYRSPVQLDFEGEGDFDIAQPYRDQLPPDGDIKASITLPQSVWGGVAYTPIPNLEVEANLVWINWGQTWEDDELRIELPGTNAMGEPNASSAPQQYENTTTFRLGAEYGLPAQHAALRAGFIYDPTPIQPETQTAQLPDINRVNVTAGGSYYFGDYAGHFSLLWVTPGERETADDPFMPQYKGIYGVTALVASLSVSGTFGK